MANEDDSWAKVKEGVKEKKSVLLLEALPRIQANSDWDSIDTLEQLVILTTGTFEKEGDPIFDENQKIVELTKSVFNSWVNHQSTSHPEFLASIYWMLGRVNHTTYEPEEARKYYEQSLKICLSDLHSTQSTRLRCVLYYSMFLWDEEEEDKAIKMTKEGFDSAIGELDTIDEDSYKEACVSLQLMRDNLTIWVEV